MGVSEHLQHTDQKSTEVRRSIAVWIAARSRRARFKKREQKEKQRIVEGEKRQRKRRAKKEYRRWLRATRKGKYRSKALGSITNRPKKNNTQSDQGTHTLENKFQRRSGAVDGSYDVFGQSSLRDT